MRHYSKLFLDPLLFSLLATRANFLPQLLIPLSEIESATKEAGLTTHIQHAIRILTKDRQEVLPSIRQNETRILVLVPNFLSAHRDGAQFYFSMMLSRDRLFSQLEHLRAQLQSSASQVDASKNVVEFYHSKNMTFKEAFGLDENLIDGTHAPDNLRSANYCSRYLKRIPRIFSSFL
jgi:hypothetical protein